MAPRTTTWQAPALTTVLIGDDGQDYLTGGAGGDYIVGGLSADYLVGGTGPDSFVFASPTEGQDVIEDFVRAEGDHILLSSAGFGINSLADGVNFFSGAAPAPGSATPTLLYDTNSGLLSYDADGSGGGGAVGIVALAGQPSLQASDFLLV